jgi:TIR domain
MDVDAIQPGVDFVSYLYDQINSCEIFLSIIGPNWLESRDHEGRRRLYNPDDFVRIEVRAALERKIRTIPVLVEGAQMPPPTELPEDVRGLTMIQALSISHNRFNDEMEYLFRAISGWSDTPKSSWFSRLIGRY